jgi:transcription elongation factor Elf1
MSSNYPEGSMMGSGIYSEEFEEDKDCPTCEKEVCVLFSTNDWQTQASGQCPDCGYEFEMEISNEPDPDDAYDAWRESQMD